MFLVVTFALAGCGTNFKLPEFSLGKKKAPVSKTAGTTPESSVKLVERDVEAPDVFQVTDTALWDGRPSLGGVWVAYPGDIQPERVIIRNEENRKFVIGALFKRERDNPGPKFQLSSDAAAALGVLAGKPTMLNVTALRREAVPADEPKKTADDTGNKRAGDGEKAAGSAEDRIKAIAAKAIDKAEGGTRPKANPKRQPPARSKADNKQSSPGKAAQAPAATPPKPISTLAKPFIQIGIFSVEQNARNTATALRTKGVLPIVKAQESRGKKFWRVLVGPARTSSERAVLLKKARALGFSDAYFVSR